MLSSQRSSLGQSPRAAGRPPARRTAGTPARLRLHSSAASCAPVITVAVSSALTTRTATSSRLHALGCGLRTVGNHGVKSPVWLVLCVAQPPMHPRPPGHAQWRATRAKQRVSTDLRISGGSGGGGGGVHAHLIIKTSPDRCCHLTPMRSRRHTRATRRDGDTTPPACLV